MDLMDYSGTEELINLNLIYTTSLFISNQRVLSKKTGLLRCEPAFHLRSESKLFTPQVEGNSHSSSINQASVTVRYSEMLMEFVIREV